MTGHGFKHMQFTTKDLPATREFWHGVLGYPIVLRDELAIGDGGSLPREIYAVGNGQYVIFLDISAHAAFNDAIDTSLYGALNRPGTAFHFAFDVGSVDQLVAKHEYLKARGVAMSEISWMIDWSAQFYFPDPVNGIQLEYTSVHFVPGGPAGLTRKYRESSRSQWLSYLEVVNHDADKQDPVETPVGSDSAGIEAAV